MCGRFSLTTPGPLLREAFDLPDLPDVTARYNIAPSQEILTIRSSEGQRVAEPRVWGLVPRWAQDAKLGPINVRSDTAAEKPMFRSALKLRRCLVPADGFFEWERIGRKKLPTYFQLSHGEPFAIAALYEHWESPTKALETVALLTTEANALVGRIHDRMPVIIPASAFDRWLDPRVVDPAALADLFTPFPENLMTARHVSERVNSPACDDPSCLNPVAAPPPPPEPLRLFDF